MQVKTLIRNSIKRNAVWTFVFVAVSVVLGYIVPWVSGYFVFLVLTLFGVFVALVFVLFSGQALYAMATIGFVIDYVIGEVFGLSISRFFGDKKKFSLKESAQGVADEAKDLMTGSVARVVRAFLMFVALLVWGFGLLVWSLISLLVG